MARDGIGETRTLEDDGARSEAENEEGLSLLALMLAGALSRDWARPL